MFRKTLVFAAMVIGGLLIFVPKGLSQHGGEDVLSLGVVPQQASERLARQWIPLANYLSEKTGLKIEFSTAPDIPEFEKRLAAGEYDVAYMNPYHFTVYNEDPGYTAVVRQRDHFLRGIIVVPATLEVESLAGLTGLDLAFPAPNAFAATLITRAFLNNIAPGYTATFVRSHDSVYRAVANGIFAGGGGILRTFNEIDPEIRSKLEILWISPGYIGHAVAAHPTVPDKTRLSLQNALIEVGDSEKGQKILEELGIKGFQVAYDADWNEVRALGLDQ
ncbi:phosphate/phosphite/phosphonate ABC transporter substrate-binding protein [Marinobacter sp. M3C]|jgi:phosphonate transport system substrate-binding protein|nr:MULTISPECIES: phosphate/phosphite/phosphonate ABC transporter substrate-binding protein [unclassified Marinobacter]MCL1478290.1 phosphate/phosphite/phosphonate ABC transporter substrate-binding protein [Marinobacter sp.]MCL1480245.1 phosphate/phosphite/phosphonate ABC transporter substrate-binding protein [Marinobacter sp.]MCL1483884.1 phosphate/phosphite/phosphonate ABC transporter substrate-binding protein [Marinobacter sp.]UQG55546.1 phosphate/phosphite/phosphonate ABC transporter substra